MSALPHRAGAAPVLFGMAIAAIAMPALAGTGAAAHRFSASGSLHAQHTANAASGNGYAAQARLGKAAAFPVSQDGRYTVGARLAAAPLACGSDLIFANGFEAPP